MKIMNKKSSETCINGRAQFVVKSEFEKERISMGNKYYELYQKHCTEVNDLMLKYFMLKYNEEEVKKLVKKAKKLHGAIAAELLKQLISEYFIKECKHYRVSAVNSYIAGSTYEYDLLIVKENAEPILGIVYQPEDVIAVIECKAGGLFGLERETDNIANAFNSACKINPEISCGYITISENVPVNEFNKYGNPTVKYWDETQELLEEKVKTNKLTIYAVTLRKGKKGKIDNLCDEGTDEEFYEFINCLISR